MKTKISLPEELLEQLRKIAAEKNKTLEQHVESVLYQHVGFEAAAKFAKPTSQTKPK